MAKGNMFLGHARGKVGSVVFSRANGKQITRTRAEVVKNPKTFKQFIQRVFLNTASQAYRYAQPLADHSFEGKQNGQECMSTFMKKNLEYMRKRVAEIVNAGGTMYDIYNYVPIGMSGLYPGPWIISDGQLPKVAVSISPFTGEGTAILKMALPVNTYRGVIEKYGLTRGDQLTIVTVEQPAGTTDFYFNFARVILDPREDDGTAASLDTPFVDAGAIVKPNSKNEGNFNTLAISGTDLTMKLTNGDVASAGIIVSRYENDSWKRSACQMIINENVVTEGNAYSLGNAIEASQGVSIDVLNELYLNNAGTGGQQSTNSGGSSPVQEQAYASNSVQFTANGNAVSQSVSGGSVQVAAPLTKVTVTGTKLDELELKAGTTNNEASAEAMTLSNGNLKAEWTGTVAAGGTLYVFKSGALWFTVGAVEGEEGSDMN